MIKGEFCLKISVDRRVLCREVCIVHLRQLSPYNRKIFCHTWWQRSYRNHFWYCSGPEQRRFGPVAEQFLFRCRIMRSIFSVLSETVASVSRSAPPTITHIWRMLSICQSHHITDDAGHQQTRLLMLAISRWLRVWGAAVRHLLSILRNCWAVLTARVSQRTRNGMHKCSSHMCIARRHRPHSQQQLHKK